MVTATSSAESEHFNEKQYMHRLFREEEAEEREEFGKQLRKIFETYQGKSIRPQHYRLLQGIKAKFIMRFEQRKAKIEEKKKKRRLMVKQSMELKEFVGGRGRN